MADHSLFQAICRVNRLDGDEKDYGYIVDYKDLFKSLDKAVQSYTENALDGFDADDRLTQAKSDLDDALETVKALCEPVKRPRDTKDYLAYFCGDTSKPEDLLDREGLRVALYKNVGKLLRCYVNVANEMQAAGYTPEQAAQIKQDVIHFEKMRDEVKLASGDYLDMKRFEPAMRHLLDMYIRADDSEQLMDFEELGLIQLIVEKGDDGLDDIPEGIKSNPEAMSEAIENNMRKTIIDENPVNPKYYERMSELLDAIIEERRKQAIDYQEYLEKIKDLARKVVKPQSDARNPYPESINTAAKRALFDNLDNDEILANKIDTAIRYTKRADWVGDRIKERQVANVIRQESAGYDVDIDVVLELAKNQHEYQ